MLLATAQFIGILLVIELCTDKVVACKDLAMFPWEMAIPFDLWPRNRCSGSINVSRQCIGGWRKGVLVINPSPEVTYCILGSEALAWHLCVEGNDVIGACHVL